MKKIDDLSGYDKASIIVDLLGDSLSLNIFNDIPESEFIQLRRHAKKINRLISTSLKKEVLDDYYFKCSRLINISRFPSTKICLIS